MEDNLKINLFIDKLISKITNNEKMTENTIKCQLKKTGLSLKIQNDDSLSLLVLSLVKSDLIYKEEIGLILKTIKRTRSIGKLNTNAAVELMKFEDTNFCDSEPHIHIFARDYLQFYFNSDKAYRYILNHTKTSGGNISPSDLDEDPNLPDFYISHLISQMRFHCHHNQCEKIITKKNLSDQNILELANNQHIWIFDDFFFNRFVKIKNLSPSILLALENIGIQKGENVSMVRKHKNYISQEKVLLDLLSQTQNYTEKERKIV